MIHIFLLDSILELSYRRSKKKKKIPPCVSMASVSHVDKECRKKLTKSNNSRGQHGPGSAAGYTSRFCFFGPCPLACQILVPQPGVEPRGSTCGEVGLSPGSLGCNGSLHEQTGPGCQTLPAASHQPSQLVLTASPKSKLLISC